MAELNESQQDVVDAIKKHIDARFHLLSEAIYVLGNNMPIQAESTPTPEEVRDGNIRAVLDANPGMPETVAAWMIDNKSDTPTTPDTPIAQAVAQAANPVTTTNQRSCRPRLKQS